MSNHHCQLPGGFLLSGGSLLRTERSSYVCTRLDLSVIISMLSSPTARRLLMVMGSPPCWNCDIQAAGCRILSPCSVSCCTFLMRLARCLPMAPSAGYSDYTGVVGLVMSFHLLDQGLPLLKLLTKRVVNNICSLPRAHLINHWLYRWCVPADGRVAPRYLRVNTCVSRKI